MNIIKMKLYTHSLVTKNLRATHSLLMILFSWVNNLIISLKVVAHTFNPTLERQRQMDLCESGQVAGQPGLHKETMSSKNDFY